MATYDTRRGGADHAQRDATFSTIREGNPIINKLAALIFADRVTGGVVVSISNSRKCLSSKATP